MRGARAATKRASASDGAVDRVGAQAAARERAAPDLHHLALAVEDLERAEPVVSRDHHVDRVVPMSIAAMRTVTSRGACGVSRFA